MHGEQSWNSDLVVSAHRHLPGSALSPLMYITSIHTSRRMMAKEAQRSTSGAALVQKYQRAFWAGPCSGGSRGHTEVNCICLE